MPVIVKICGITSAGDAETAVKAGADALGLMFYERSTRHVRLELARDIASVVPPGVLKVGVFVNAPAEYVREAAEVCGLDRLQFHGEETPEFCLSFGVRAIKSFRVAAAESLAACEAYATEAWLLDAFTAGSHGGTGARFDWEIAVAAHRLGRPFFLAGGLTPENVEEAVRRVRPYGVDVSSGVESVPGKKDPVKVRDFVRRAKAAAV